MLPIRKPIERVFLGTSSLRESQFATEVPVIRPWPVAAWSRGSPSDGAMRRNLPMVRGETGSGSHGHKWGAGEVVTGEVA